jgi:serine/threonine protein kinase
MRIGDYILEEELGRGPSASTWLATRSSNNIDQPSGGSDKGSPEKIPSDENPSDLSKPAEKAVLKILDFTATTTWNTVDIFRREAEALKHLSHPSIPQYLGSFESEEDGKLRFILAMEYIRGKNLEKIVASGTKFTETEVEGIVAQLCDILSYLGSLRPPIVHRDINPRNIIMREDGSIVLVDFSGVQDAVRSSLYPGATLVGTAGYIPLEQVGGKATHKSDLYGAAATAVFLLTGRNPAELPSRSLKVDLSGLIDISAKLAPILSSWLEPDVFMRTLSAEKAAKILRGELDIPEEKEASPSRASKAASANGSLLEAFRENIINATTPANSKKIRYPESMPSDSKVYIQRTEDSSIVNFPRIGIRSSAIPGATFAVFWVGFVAFWTMMTLRMRAPIFFPFFSIPFWVIGFALIKSTLAPAISRYELSISKEQLSVKTWTLGAEKTVSWPIDDIGAVKMVPSKFQSQGTATKELVIPAGTSHQRLGLGLSERELLYLEKYLNEELDRLHRS